MGLEDIGAGGSRFAREVTRRRLTIAAAGMAAGALPWQTLAAQTTTPSAGTPTAQDQKITQFLTLSKELCGGGTFDRAGAEQLLQLLGGDARLASGLEELLTVPPVA